MNLRNIHKGIRLCAITILLILLGGIQIHGANYSDNPDVQQFCDSIFGKATIPMQTDTWHQQIWAYAIGFMAGKTPAGPERTYIRQILNKGIEQLEVEWEQSSQPVPVWSLDMIKDELKSAEKEGEKAGTENKPYNAKKYPPYNL